MSQPVNIQATSYDKGQFNLAVDTGFTEFTDILVNTMLPEDSISIVEFFTTYRKLFLEIPKEGEVNSHQYLINTSKEYTGGEDISAEVVALVQEVTELREENIELQKQVSRLAGLSSSDIINKTA